MTAVLLFAATFGVVLALGLQQLNVQGGHRLLAALTSIGIGSLQLIQFKLLPGPTTAIEIAGFLLGGPTGIVTAMVIHPRLVRLFRRPL